MILLNDQRPHADLDHRLHNSCRITFTLIIPTIFGKTSKSLLKDDRIILPKYKWNL